MLSARSSLIINRRPQGVEKGCQKVGHDIVRFTRPTPRSQAGNLSRHDSDQNGKTTMAEKIFRHEVHVSELDHCHTERRKQRGKGRVSS